MQVQASSNNSRTTKGFQLVAAKPCALTTQRSAAVAVMRQPHFHSGGGMVISI